MRKLLLSMLLLSLPLAGCSAEPESQTAQPTAKARVEQVASAEQGIGGVGEVPAVARPAAKGPRFIEGKHYKATTKPTAPETGDKVEVVEIFWYGCPHCYTLEPEVVAWKNNMPAEASFRRMPAALNRSWKIHARAYYAAEALGIVERIHAPFFDAIHKQGRRLLSEDELAGFFAAHGVARDDFQAAFQSFSVDGAVRKSEQVVRGYGLNSVPAVVVNGRWWTSPSLAGGNDKVFDVVNYLIEREQQ